MKAKYPIFLSRNPRFLGFSLSDLIILGLGLSFSMLFKVGTIYLVIITLGLVVINKLVCKYIDVKGLLYGRAVKEFKWMDSVNREVK